MGIKEKLLNGDADLVFIEVKSGKLNSWDVSRETPNLSGKRMVQGETFLPEEHIDSRKKRLLIRSAQIYLAYKKLPLDINWQIDVIAVDIDEKNQKANLRHIKKAVTL